MSIGNALANMFAGGLVGVGSGISSQAIDRDKEEAQRKADERRAQIEMDRALALEEVRAKNNKSANEQKFVQDVAIRGMEAGYRTAENEARETGVNKRHGEDVELRRTDLESRREDRNLTRAGQAADRADRSADRKANLDLGYARITAEHGDISKLPQVDQLALKSVESDLRANDAVLSKTLATAFGDPSGQQAQDLIKERAALRATKMGILKRNGYVDPVASKPTEPSDNKVSWENLPEDKRALAINRLEGMKGTKEYDAAVKEMVNKYGMPADAMSGEKGDSLIRGAAKWADKALRGSKEQPEGGLVAGGRSPKDIEHAKSRADFVKSLTSDNIGKMGVDEARAVLQDYSTSLTLPQRMALRKQIGSTN